MLIGLVAGDEFLAELLGSQPIAPKAKRRRRDEYEDPTLEVSGLKGEDDHLEKRANGEHEGERRDIDDLLPIAVSA